MKGGRAAAREQGQRTRTARQEQRLDHRRREILRAAAEVFQEMGYERATLEAIGEAVGLSKTSLYYYVRSKEELLARLFVQLIERMEDESRADGVASPHERLRRFVHAHVRVVCTDPSGHLLATHQDALLGGTDSELMRETRRRHELRLIEILEDGVEQGAFRDLDARVGAFLILGALSGVGRWYSPRGPATPEVIAESFLALVLSGIEACGHEQGGRHVG